MYLYVLIFLYSITSAANPTCFEDVAAVRAYDALWEGKVAKKEINSKNYNVWDENGFSFEASVNHGSLEITADLKKADQRSVLSGKHEFRRAATHLDRRFYRIRGHWIYGDNLKKINDLTGPPKNMPLKDAIKETWTAAQAAKRGYSEIRFIPAEVAGVPGEYSELKVWFYKPGQVHLKGSRQRLLRDSYRSVDTNDARFFSDAKMGRNGVVNWKLSALRRSQVQKKPRRYRHTQSRSIFVENELRNILEYFKGRAKGFRISVNSAHDPSISLASESGRAIRET